mmetsp:Transcript_80948/g.262348  ORF Transcript_80948/g.262348 Transcript_80948/m.262348 type:complete len:80 (+) Transcript_80948:105-344(+)
MIFIELLGVMVAIYECLVTTSLLAWNQQSKGGDCPELFEDLDAARSTPPQHGCLDDRARSRHRTPRIRRFCGSPALADC